jgi:hypothetical protein
MSRNLDPVVCYLLLGWSVGWTGGGHANECSWLQRSIPPFSLAGPDPYPQVDAGALALLQLGEIAFTPKEIIAGLKLDVLHARQGGGGAGRGGLRWWTQVE